MTEKEFLSKTPQADENLPIVNNEEKFHKKARKEKHKSYPERFPVPDEYIDWNIPYPGYNPICFESDVVLQNDVTINPKGWADPKTPEEAEKTRELKSYEGNIKYDNEGYPINPKGRTGIRGRGVLGKWGANFAADPIITRIEPDTGLFQLVVIKRKDTGEWAIPGGMVDFGETISRTLKRELKEEAGINLDFENTEKVYEGYVDDPRNTDNAWMEAKAYHFHLDDENSKIELKASYEVEDARFLTVSEGNLSNLYASHNDLIREAIFLWQKKTGLVVDKNGLVGKPQ